MPNAWTIFLIIIYLMTKFRDLFHLSNAGRFRGRLGEK